MLHFAQFFFYLINVAPGFVIFLLGFIYTTLHVFLLRIHGNQVGIIRLRGFDDQLYLIFILLQLFVIQLNALAALLHLLLFEANFLLNAFYTVFLLMVGNVLFIKRC